MAMSPVTSTAGDGYRCGDYWRLRLLLRLATPAAGVGYGYNSCVATKGGYDCGPCCVTAATASATVPVDETVAGGSCCGWRRGTAAGAMGIVY